MKDKEEGQEFDINMEDGGYSDIMKKVTESEGNVKRINIEKVKNESQDLLDFLLTSFPTHLPLFSFNTWYSGEMVNMFFYQTGILNAIKGVTKEVYFYYMNISKEELEEIFKACSQVNKLSISNSKLDLNTFLELEGKEYIIQHLSFRWCGKNHKNNRNSNPGRVHRLVESMSETSLQTSLQTFNIFNCGISMERTIEIFKENKMEHVKVHKVK